MKRIVAIVAAIIVLAAGVGYAAETAVPTLADVMTTLAEIKADLAALKADGFTRTAASGKLATASTKDGLVSIEVTSVTAGPDGTIVGVTITNKTTDKHARMMTSVSTSLVAGTAQVKMLEDNGPMEVLPGTSGKYVLLFDALPKGTTEVTLRTQVYDSRAFDDLLEPTLVIKLPK